MLPERRRRFNLFRVDDHDEVAGIHVRRIFRLVLAAQARGDGSRDTAQRLPFGIHQQPVVGHFARSRAIRLHQSIESRQIEERECYLSAGGDSTCFGFDSARFLYNSSASPIWRNFH